MIPSVFRLIVVLLCFLATYKLKIVFSMESSSLSVGLPKSTWLPKVESPAHPETLSSDNTHIKTKLTENARAIADLKAGYTSLRSSIDELERGLHETWKFVPLEERDKGILAAIDRLNDHHREYMLVLVQNRLTHLVEIGSSMTSLGVGIPPPASDRFREFSNSFGHSFFSTAFQKESQETTSHVSFPQKGSSASKGKEPIGSTNLHQDSPFEPTSQENSDGAEKQAQQTLTDSQLISKRKTTQNLAQTRELPPELLETIIPMTRLATVKRLQGILHDLTPPKLEERSEEFEKEWLRVKIGFERCVFQTLDFLRDFKLLTEEETKSFFKSRDAIKDTSRHLSDLFSFRMNGFSGYHTFVPDWNFMTNDWHTVHLHRWLKELDEIDKSYLMYSTLLETIQVLDEISGKESKRTPATLSINKFFSQPDFLDNFLHWSPSEPWMNKFSKAQDDLLKVKLKEVVNLFQNFHDSPDHEVASSTKKVEYLINYHIFHFMKTYANNHVKGLIHNYPDPGLLELQYDIMTVGLALHQILNRHDDYEYLRTYRLYQGRDLDAPPPLGQHFLILQYIPLRNELQRLEQTELQESHESLVTWKERFPIHEFLDFLHSAPVDLTDSLTTRPQNKNLWLESITPHVEAIAWNPILRGKLLNHLKSYFAPCPESQSNSKSVSSENVVSVFPSQ